MSRRVRGNALRSIAVLGLALLGVVFASGPAHACHNAILRDTQTETRKLLVAERRLAEGETAIALRSADSVLRWAARNRTEDGVRELRARAELIVALVTVRRGGAVDPRARRVMPHANAVQRGDALRWAVVVLETRARVDRGARARAWVAEARLRIDAGDQVARQELEQLAARDVVPDGWAWAALARVRERAGDAAGRDRAIERCGATSGDHARYVCPRVVPA